MNLYLRYIASVFCLVFFSCQSTQPLLVQTFQPAEQLVFQQLLAKNLSEDMALTTMNDEVLLFFSIVEKKREIWEEQHRIDFLPFTFNKKMDHRELSDSLLLKSFSPESIAVFGLVELDEENSETKVRKVLQEFLSSGRFLKNLDFREMNTLLGDDDFLGLRHYPLNALEKGTIIEIHLIEVRLHFSILPMAVCSKPPDY